MVRGEQATTAEAGAVRWTYAPTRCAAILAIALVALSFVALLSLAVGSRSIRLGTVVDALLSYDPADQDHLIVRSLRVPRTLLGLLVGVALGLAGAVMQGVARNPLADPGILGVEAGAALFVVVGIYIFGIGALLGYVWFAFAGAGARRRSSSTRWARSAGRGDAGQAGARRRGRHRVPRLDHVRDPADRRRHARPVPLLGSSARSPAATATSPARSRRSSSSAP